MDSPKSRKDISMLNGILLKSIPEHENVSWPRITAELKNMIKNGSTFYDERNQPVKSILPNEIPEIPWTKIATDKLR